jgi:hypothetical protein
MGHNRTIQAPFTRGESAVAYLMSCHRDVPKSFDHCNVQPACRRQASIQDQFIIRLPHCPGSKWDAALRLWEDYMKASACKSETPRLRSTPRGNERRLVTHHPRRRILSLAAGAAALPTISRMAWAQAYPTRPVRIIVGFPPGGGTDITARLMGQWLSERLGQRFFIENRVGAAGNIGTEAVVRAPADGYTLLLFPQSSSAINATLYDKLNFNFIRDIAPVASINRTPHVIDVNPSIPVRTVPRRRDREVGQGHPGGQHQGGVTLARDQYSISSRYANPHQQPHVKSISLRRLCPDWPVHFREMSR